MRTKLFAIACTLLPIACTHAQDVTPAPADAEHPWPIPVVTGPGETAPAIMPDATHAYDLAELIDMAQRLNPETRRAWEEAQAAASAVGLARSAYLPQLSIDALAGYQRTPLPIPTTLIRKGYFTSDTREVLPSLTAKWLLFDFGRRRAALDQAQSSAFVANVAFTGAHQKLAYTISHDYFDIDAALGRLHAAEQGLDTAGIDAKAVATRRKQGVATVVEDARARRLLAQANYALVRAQGQLDLARATLVADIGLPPGTALQVASTSSQSLPLPPSDVIKHYIDQALMSRPDVVAAIGKIHAADAGIAEAKAAWRPTIAALGKLYQNEGSLRSDGGDWYSVHKPGWGVFFQLNWPLFDGGERRARLSIAQAEREAAVANYDAARDTASKEVAGAFTTLRTALAAVQAASAVTSSARTSHDAAFSAFSHGTATYDELSDETNALLRAETDEVDARASAFTAAAALAFATGQLLNDGKASSAAVKPAW